MPKDSIILAFTEGSKCIYRILSGTLLISSSLSREKEMQMLCYWRLTARFV